MGNSFRLCCIVEGHGEIDAVPALVHRICQERRVPAPVIPRPMRCDRHRLIKSGETERAVRLAIKGTHPSGGVLMLADADDDCAAKIGPQLLERARQAAGNVPVALSLACREYESWFLSAAESFRGFHGLPADLATPVNAEEIRGAKEWLRKSAGTGGNYRPSVDLVRFTRQLDLELARRSQSFRRFEREVLALITLKAP
jgi:hypothetical protein